MSQSIHLDLELPDDLARFKLPAGVNERLTPLLPKQDSCQALTDLERREAEDLVDLAKTLTYLGLQAKAAALAFRTPDPTPTSYLAHGFAFYAYRPGRFAVSLRGSDAGAGTGRCITFCEGSQP